VSLVSRVVVSLICFAIVEFQQADQIIRQFGFHQHIKSRSASQTRYEREHR